MAKEPFCRKSLMDVGQADQHYICTVWCLLEKRRGPGCCLWTVRKEVNGLKVWAVLIKVLFAKHLVKYVEEFVLWDVTPYGPFKNRPTIRRNMSLPFSGSKNK
jgi:hypothetical protein